MEDKMTQEHRVATRLFRKFHIHQKECDALENTKDIVRDVIDEIIDALKTTTGHGELRRLDQAEVEHDIKFWKRVKGYVKIINQ